jgi:hypothetical protein
MSFLDASCVGQVLISTGAVRQLLILSTIYYYLVGTSYIRQVLVGSGVVITLIPDTYRCLAWVGLTSQCETQGVAATAAGAARGGEGGQESAMCVCTGVHISKFISHEM